MLATAAPALASDSLSAAATPYQNEQIADALANNPSGTRVAPAVVEWNNGSVTMTVPYTADGSVSSLSAGAIATVPAGSDATVTSGSESLTSARSEVVTPDSAASNCPSYNPLGEANWSCVYNETDGNGTRLQFKDADIFQDLRAYGGFSWVTLSWANHLGVRAWLFPQESLSSNPSLCMGPNSSGSNSQGSWSGDEYIYIGTNSSPC
jgi:hypothetical protein